MKKPKVLDLENPFDAREFFDLFRVNGEKVELVEALSGEYIFVNEMTPAQVCYYAQSVYLDWLGSDQDGTGCLGQGVDVAISSKEVH